MNEWLALHTLPSDPPLFTRGLANGVNEASASLPDPCDFVAFNQR